MRNGGTDWIVYVAWKTITEWKQNVRAAVDARESTNATSQQDADRPDDYPFQYASNQPRFMKMRQGDRLWLVTLPQFQGFCQAPSIMARLQLEGVYDREKGVPGKVSPHSNVFGRYLAVGELGRAIDTYPPLYNIFDVLMDAKFEGKEKDLSKYKNWLDQSNFGAEGPYYRLAQHFRTLRQLTEVSGERLRKKHEIAVDGRRIFLSYKASDFTNRDAVLVDKESDWLKSLVNALETADILSWWDAQQMLGQRGAWNQQTDLIGALLDDGVRQATWFVALGTDGYGSAGYSGRRWTLEEWEAAGSEAVNTRRRGKLQRLIVEFGECDVSTCLPGKADVTVRVAAGANPEDVAAVIAAGVSS